jgi:hypothetical protein
MRNGNSLLHFHTAVLAFHSFKKNGSVSCPNFVCMKYCILAILNIAMLQTDVAAQATGNVIYNSNNRFMQNSNYRRSSSGAMYNSAAPQVTYQDNTASFNFAGDGQFQPSGWVVNSNEVVMNINVLYNATPTGYMAIFHINQAGKKISDLDTMMNKRVGKFIELAKSIGLTKENFYIDMIALVPIFREDKRNNTKPKGFEIQKNIHVKYSEPGQLDKLFSMAAQCEIYDLIKVEYLYSESEKVGAEMHAKALQMLQRKIDHYKKIGVTVDTAVRTISEAGNVFFPIDKYTSYQPLSVNSLEEEDKPGTEQELMKTKVGMINRTTVFYNPTDLSGFDAVVNANPLEPPIQFTYTLQVRYRMTQPVNKVVETKIEKQHEILIVTPQGEIKTINK